VLDLLRHDPELLAIADAVAATQLLDPEEVPKCHAHGTGTRRGDLGPIAEQ
jgi:hypothetical protein